MVRLRTLRQDQTGCRSHSARDTRKNEEPLLFRYTTVPCCTVQYCVAEFFTDCIVPQWAGLVLLFLWSLLWFRTVVCSRDYFSRQLLPSEKLGCSA